jgi:hypothetical protein
MDKIKRTINVDTCRSHRNGLLPFVRYGSTVIENVNGIDGNGNYGQYVCDFTILNGDENEKKEVARLRYLDIIDVYDIFKNALKESVFVKKIILREKEVTAINCGSNEENKATITSTETYVPKFTANFNEYDEKFLYDYIPLDISYFDYYNGLYGFNLTDVYNDIKNKPNDELTDEEKSIIEHFNLINNSDNKFFILINNYSLLKNYNNKWENWWVNNFKSDGKWRNLVFDGYQELNYPILQYNILNFYIDVNKYILGIIEVPNKYKGTKVPPYVYYVTHNNYITWFESNSASTVESYESNDKDKEWIKNAWEERGSGEFYDFLNENKPLWQTFKSNIEGDEGKYFSYSTPYLYINTLINAETDIETLYNIYEYSIVDDVLEGAVKPYTPVSYEDIVYVGEAYNEETKKTEFFNAYYMKDSVVFDEEKECFIINSSSVKTNGLTKQWLSLSASNVETKCESKLNTLEHPSTKIIFENIKGIFKTFNENEDENKGQMFKCTLQTGTSITPYTETYFSAVTTTIDEDGNSYTYVEPMPNGYLKSVEPEELPKTANSNAYQIFGVKNISTWSEDEEEFSTVSEDNKTTTECYLYRRIWREYSWWECEKVDYGNLICGDGEDVPPNEDEKYRNVTIATCIVDAVGACNYGDYFYFLVKYDNGNTNMGGKHIDEIGEIKSTEIPYKVGKQMNIETYDNNEVVYDKIISITPTVENSNVLKIVYAKGITDGADENTSGIHYEETILYEPHKKMVIPFDGVYMAEIYCDVFLEKSNNEIVYSDEYKLTRETRRAKIIGMEICTQWTEEGAIDAMLITKDGYEGLQTEPKYDINLTFNRGNASSWEHHFKLSECNTMEDLENYGNNFFNF